MTKKRTTASSKKTKTYCVCQCDETDRRFMVACDGCNDWFHPSCIGTTRQEVEKMRNFYCPKCREERSGGASAAEAASASTATAADTKSNPDTGKISKLLNDVINDAAFSEKVESAIFARYGSDYKQYLRRATGFLRELVKKKHTSYRAQFKDRVANGTYTVESLAAPESPLFGTLEDAEQGSDAEDDVTAAMTSASPVPLKRARLDYTKCPNSEIAWKGTIQKNNKSNFGTFHVAGRLVYGSADVIDLLPDTIEFAGRLITKKLCQYLHQLHKSKSRKFSVLRIDPEADGDVDCFGNVFEYFTTRKRSGSLQNLNKVVPPEEMYLLPLLPNEQAPLFLAEAQATEMDVVNFEAAVPRLFLIVVVKVEHLKKPGDGVAVDQVVEEKKGEGEKSEEGVEEAKKDTAEEIKKEAAAEEEHKMVVEEEKKEEVKKEEDKKEENKMVVEEEKKEEVKAEEVKEEVKTMEETKKEEGEKKEEEKKTEEEVKEDEKKVEEVPVENVPSEITETTTTTTTTTTQETAPVAEAEKVEEEKKD